MSPSFLANSASCSPAAEEHHIGIVRAVDGTAHLVVEIGEVPVAHGWVDHAVERHEHTGRDSGHPGSLSVLRV
jgi:hypothetical protein